MADPSSYRPAPGSIPVEPGVYKFRDAYGRVIYVGKAKSLRSRLNSYFADLSALHPRTRQMVTTAASVEWTVVGTEVEALQLEYNWIKEYDPRFNIRYRDDKSYPSLAVTLNEEFPRLQVMRGPKKPGVRYFGPYAHAWAIRETLDLLLRVFPARTCSAGVFRRSAQIGRPCLLGYIDKCSAPCVGRVTADEHRQIVDDFCDFMAGKTDSMMRRLEKQMAAASADLEFEQAARLRDDLTALRRSMEKQAVVLTDGTDADVIAFAHDELAAAVQIFHVRGGRVRGQRGWVVDRVDDVRDEEKPDADDEQALVAGLVDQFITQFYGADDAGVPREVLVPELPGDTPALTEWLSAKRGSRVSLRIPQRGDKRSLMATVQRNAEEAFVRHKLRRASDLTSRSQALADLQDALGMDDAPLRIECYDISHVQGTDVVASMVVFEDGLPRKSEYRRFAMRTQGGDTDWIAEVIRRRFARYQAERAIDPEVERAEMEAAAASGAVGRPRKFSYPPNLVVIDGGAPQVNAAEAVLADLGIIDMTLIGLAKRLEEVWLPGEEHPLILPRASESLYLLQRVRDEAHRFAITYHRQKRSKTMVESVLGDIAGLGPARRKALLKEFSSLKRLRSASVDDIAALPGFGTDLAQRIVDALAADEPAAPAVNMATGEVLE
jgi:excinuclease ABC subunit C